MTLLCSLSTTPPSCTWGFFHFSFHVTVKKPRKEISRDSQLKMSSDTSREVLSVTRTYDMAVIGLSTAERLLRQTQQAVLVPKGVIPRSMSSRPETRN